MSRTRPIYAKRPMIRKKFPAAKRRTTVQTRARQLAREMVNQRTGGFVGLELKFYDLADNGIAPGNNGNMSGGTIDNNTIDCLNAMAEGNNQSTRIGRKITMKNIQIRGTIKWASTKLLTDPNIYAPVYIAIVLDTQNNSGTGLVSQNVFTNPGLSTQCIANPLRNLEYTSRYRVLKWGRYTNKGDNSAVDAATDHFSSAGFELPFTLFCNLNNMQVLYNASTPNSTDITDNALHLVAFARGSDVTISWNSRLRYVG